MEVLLFKNDLFGELRTTIGQDGVTYFVARDVALALGYSNPHKAIRDHIDEEDKLTERIVQSGQTRRMILTNESGLYSLVLSSKLDCAREFKRWITSDVLPQIRQTGGFIPLRIDDGEKQQMVEAMDIMKRTQKWQNEQIKLQKNQLRVMKPMVEFAQGVSRSADTCTVAEMAKLLCDNGFEIGQNRLFQWFRDHHYLCKSKHHWNEPVQTWIKSGLFKVKDSVPWTDEMGRKHYYVVTLITGEGQRYFYEKFKKAKELAAEENLPSPYPCLFA